LHTFRKEGRILKKSAQERSIKKKPESMIDVEAPKSRMLKKTSISIEKDKSSKSLTNLAGRGLYSKESTPVGSLTRLDEGSYEQGQYGGMEQESNSQQRKVSYHHDDHHYANNKMNYYMNYNDAVAHQQHHEVGRSYMLTEGLEHHGNYGMHYPREYETYTDMANLHHRPAQVDEYFTDPSAAFLHQRELNAHHQMEDRYFKNEHVDYEHAETSYNPLKSFMDTQSVFRDALRKANNVSYSNSNNAGFRKSSIDLF